MVHVFCHLEEMEDGLAPLCDMTFEIIDKVYDEEASSWRLVFRADATPYEPVGFCAIIPVTGWREQVEGEGDDAFHSFWGPVTLKSLGDDSDRLLALLAEYYGISTTPSASSGWLKKKNFQPKDSLLSAEWSLANSIECFAVGIASNPAAISSDFVRMKLFFDDGVENGRYAEIFLNIDMPQGFCALNEKDEGYRSDLVHWLSQPGDIIANPYAGKQ
ncbi:hypothetical protein [uncultured Sphingomonas sp.]|uniref:hypothetical protein n=1 Tax=uncultured Sphingomonas sp. TaxID=158754 RepID=UPI002623AEAF|nr:hypothetical protein [uncultured Sphingomonas sp.]